MKILFSLFLCSTLGLLSSFSQNSNTPPLVNVSGEAEIRVAPDVVLITFGVEARANDLDAAVEAHEKKIEKLIGHIKELGVEGMVVISFIVEKDGSVSNIKILRDPGAETGTEAKRVVQLMQQQGIKWVPGYQRGRPVRVQYNLPVRFRLTGDEEEQ